MRESYIEPSRCRLEEADDPFLIMTVAGEAEPQGGIEPPTCALSRRAQYKSIGVLRVKADDREAIKKELEEHQETLTIRVIAIQKQERALGERYEDLGRNIQAALGAGPQAG